MKVLGMFCLALAGSVSLGRAFEGVDCRVVDPAGAAVPGAHIAVSSAQGATVQALVTDTEGRCPVAGLGQGSYELEVVAPGFEKAYATLEFPAPRPEPLVIRLEIAKINSEVTVTSRRGAVESVASADQLITVRGRDQLVDRPGPTIASGLEAAPGVMVQQTTWGAGAPYLRGLTGYQTLLLVDGVRFNTSILRSGPNQYLALVPANAADRVEVSLGPSGASYGSDSMGGTINVVSAGAPFSAAGRELHGEVTAFGDTADDSGRGGVRLMGGSRRIGWTVGTSLDRHNDLRSGRGEDSHNVYRRYFGLDSAQVARVFGTRAQDTGFFQYSADGHLAVRLSDGQTLTFRAMRSDLQNVRSYRDQAGGAYKIQSAFDPQSLNFGYVRYEKLRTGPFDTISGTVSLNQQNDGNIQQTALATDVVTKDNSRVNAHGYTGQATMHAGSRNLIVFGGETDRERIHSRRLILNPVGGITTEDRPLYPDNSLYTLTGAFAQESADLVRNHLQATVGIRFTDAHYLTRAADNIAADGHSLGVIDSDRNFRDVTFHAALAWRISSKIAATAMAGRGFRAPNVNDLGSVGARTLGYDVPAADAIAVNALAGLDSSDSAAPAGTKVGTLGAESLYNYELGWRWQSPRLYVRSHFFDAELLDPISSRTLLFPTGAVPSRIAGIEVFPLSPSAAQKAAGVVPVCTIFSPRAVHTAINSGHTRYFGADNYFRYAVASNWTVEAQYSFLGGLDLNPVRPTRRLPPQQGGLTLRYIPRGKRPWVEASILVSGAQHRLNGGDVDDDRIGASRRRSDVASFFRSYFVSRYISAGPDGRAGTADDIFTPTGETLRQIEDRVLPLNATINGIKVTGDGVRVPLYMDAPGWTCLSLRGGYPLGENLHLSFGIGNLLDRKYRVFGSGTDAPGFRVFAGLRYQF